MPHTTHTHTHVYSAKILHFTQQTHSENHIELARTYAMQYSLYIVLLCSLYALTLALLLCHRAQLSRRRRRRDVAPLCCYFRLYVVVQPAMPAAAEPKLVEHLCALPTSLPRASKGKQNGRCRRRCRCRCRCQAKPVRFHSFNFQFTSNARTVRTCKRQWQSSAY